MIFIDSEFSKLSQKQKEIVLAAASNIDHLEIWKITLISAIFIFPFSALYIQAWIWNLFFWRLPKITVHYLQSIHYLQVVSGYIMGYILTFTYLEIKKTGEKMTDRYNSFVVVLTHDIRDDDAEPILNAIRQIRGVFSVEGNISDSDSIIAYSRARRDLTDKLWKVLHPNYLEENKCQS